MASGRILNCHLQSVGADGSKSAAFAVWRSMRHCSSCPSPLPPLSTAKSEKRESQSPSVRGYSSSSSTPKVPDDTAPDHRTVATSQNLFFTTSVSPGSPIFLPNGARIFNKLTSFLRAQYALYGFEEVLSPTIYKKSLWQQSGHWENYKNDMFEVRGRGASGLSGGAVAGAGGALELGEEEEYGLKPMNCPGHCLIYRSSNKSYRDLPIRYADFSPLHRYGSSYSLLSPSRIAIRCPVKRIVTSKSLHCLLIANFCQD